MSDKCLRTGMFDRKVGFLNFSANVLSLLLPFGLLCIHFYFQGQMHRKLWTQDCVDAINEMLPNISCAGNNLFLT